MRLLFIQNFAPTDERAFGGQRIHHELTRAMATRGHDARAVFLTPDSTLPPLPYPAWGVEETGRLRTDARAIGAALPIIFEQWKPDVVYGGAAESVQGLQWASDYCATVATSHHYDPPDLGHRLSLAHPITAIRRWRQLHRFRMEAQMLGGADLVIATSLFGASALKTRGYLTPDTPTPVLFNGVDDAWFSREGSFAPDATAAEGAQKGFLFIGRMDTQKGVDVLLEALTLRSGRWPVTLVGGGWMEEEYRALADQLGVGDVATFAGLVPHDDVCSQAPDFDAFVLPSRAENCPLVLLEAMASGLPVVASRVGGIPELVENEESALLVPADDPRQLAEAMDRIEQDDSLRERLVTGGTTVADRQRWSAVAERLEALLIPLVPVD